MLKPTVITAALFAICELASAQGVLLAGHVHRVTLQPPGTENCPPVCPATATKNPDGTTAVCLSNAGGCETMEVKVDHVYLGEIRSETRQFKSRIGEWGPSFPVTEKKIIVSEENGNVFWSVATERDGKIFFDPQRLRTVGGIPTAVKGDTALVSLDQVLARINRTY